MEKFVGSVTDEPLRERLIISIDGKGAFRRFKDVLLAYPAERERWFSYRAELLHWHIQQWLESHDIHPTNEPPWGAVEAPTELPPSAARRARHRGAGRGAAPPGARSDRDHPGDRAADRDRVPGVLEAAQRRGDREGASTSPSCTTTKRLERIVSSIEALATELVQEAPTLDPAVARRAARRAASKSARRSRCRSRASTSSSSHGLVDPAIALPALAEACATLVAGIEGTVGDRVLEAARYQIDTLTPMPNKPKNLLVTPDVPLISLKRK